jgi:hypothetical protein
MRRLTVAGTLLLVLGCAPSAFNLAPEGDPCGVDTQCATGYCAGGLCTTLGPGGRAGLVCGGDGDCGGLLCDPSVHRCVACGMGGRPSCPSGVGDGGPFPGDGAPTDGPLDAGPPVDGTVQDHGQPDGPPGPDGLDAIGPGDLPDGPTTTQEIYVAQMVGNDINDGSAAAPLATLGEAHKRALQLLGPASTGVTIRVAQGIYAEQVVVVARADLLGGHDCTQLPCTWVRDPAQFESQLQAVDFQGVVVPGDVGPGTRIDGFHIVGMDGSPSTPGGSAAMTVLGSAMISTNLITGGTVTGGPDLASQSSFGVLVTTGAGATATAPVILGNDISGGSSVGTSAAVALAMAAGVSPAGGNQPTVRLNTLTGGPAAISVGLAVRQLPGVIRENTIVGGAVTGQASVSWGVVIDGSATVDANVINPHRAAAASCTGSMGCGGILVTAGSPVITNNVVFGASAPLSAGISLFAQLGPVTDVVISSNYIGAVGTSNSSGSTSVAIGLSIGDNCSGCSTGQSAARIRNNIIDLGVAPNRFGVYEEAGSGQTIHPGALQNNDLFRGTSLMGVYYRTWNGSQGANITSIDTVNSNLGIGGSVGANFDQDPLFDLNAYTLDPTSPCVNQGTTADAPSTDRQGDPRPLVPGTKPDVGPDEVQ